MPAIITDQFRILNAKNFVNDVVVGSANTTNVYYTFVGMPTPDLVEGGGSATWTSSPPNPIDSFNEENSYHDSILTLKRINENDLTFVIPKIKWEANRVYEPYRNNYSINNKTPVNEYTTLYNAEYYVLTSDYRVYICLDNGTNASNPSGQLSKSEPDFVDVEPQPAGDGSDGYIWKYLFSIKPQDVIKFDSVEYIPVPKNWGVSGEAKDIKDNAIDGEIKTVFVTETGSNYSTNVSSWDVPILGDGENGVVNVEVGSDGRVSNVTIKNGGTGYTKGTILFYPNATPELSGLTQVGVASTAVFEVVIPPKGGHGYDIYRELGANKVMVYSRYDRTVDNNDYITGNQFSRIGIIKNPLKNGSTDLLTDQQVSGVGALRLVGSAGSTTEYDPDSVISQTVGIASTAYGIVVSYDSDSGVLKYIQPTTLSNSTRGYKLHKFTANPGVGGTTTIQRLSGSTTGSNLRIDTTYSGITTTINSVTKNLGLTFTNGVANPEIKKYSGEIIYVDNREPIPRSLTQIEDIRIVIDF